MMMNGQTTQKSFHLCTINKSKYSSILGEFFMDSTDREPLIINIPRESQSTFYSRGRIFLDQSPWKCVVTLSLCCCCCFDSVQILGYVFIESTNFCIFVISHQKVCSNIYTHRQIILHIEFVWPHVHQFVLQLRYRRRYRRRVISLGLRL